MYFENSYSKKTFYTIISDVAMPLNFRLLQFVDILV